MGHVKTFEEFLSNIADSEHRSRTEEVLSWVVNKFPNLVPVIKWNQPMFTDHGTYIIGFSIAKHHLAVSPEAEGIEQFLGEIDLAGYTKTKGLMRIPWNSSVDFSLLEKMINYNIADKADCTTFWR